MDASVLEKISDIENAASKVYAQMTDKKRDLQKEADERIAAFDKKTDERTASQIKKTRERLERKLEVRLSGLEKDARRTMDEMQEHFENQSDARVDEIIAKILR